MKEYIILRINNKFKDLFKDNLIAFLELFNRREESVFYKQQFLLFLEKNKTKEILKYLDNKYDDREDILKNYNKYIFSNKYNASKEEIEVLDNYLIIKGDINKSIFVNSLNDYDSGFIYIDKSRNKIGLLRLVNY